MGRGSCARDIRRPHPNVVLPHDKILQAVWGPDYGDEVEYLRVFVNQLRKKLEPDPSQPRYILTEPWLGYRFDTLDQNTGEPPAWVSRKGL